MEDRVPREIGEYIRHEDFSPEALAQEAEEYRDQFNNLSETEQIFLMDHDFVCIKKLKPSEEVISYFDSGLENYIQGDWAYA